MAWQSNGLWSKKDLFNVWVFIYRLKQGAFLCASLFLLGACADSMDYSSSPQFNREKGRFEHPNGVQHDKSFFDMLGLATQYFSRSQDPAETTGFPLNETGSAALEDFSENLIWIGQSSLLVNHNDYGLLRRYLPLAIL